MATLTTFTANTTIASAAVNANFVALNTQVTTGTADQVYRVPHAGGDGAFGNLHSATLMSLGTGTSTGRLVVHAFTNQVSAANVSTGETDLHSWTAAAGTFTGAKGDGMLIRSVGNFAANASTKTLKLKLGGATAMVLNLTTTAPNNKNFAVDLLVMVNDTTTFYVSGMVYLGAVGAIGTAGGSPSLEAAGFLGAPTVADVMASQVVKFTGTGGATFDVNLYTTDIFVFRAPA